MAHSSRVFAIALLAPDLRKVSLCHVETNDPQLRSRRAG
jgi:hypothetical protein